MGSMTSILVLVLLFAVMYFLMIRPQKKKEKETKAMRAGIQVGDEIVTIGGICAKVVKTKEESIIVQMGPDKVKVEFMRWAVSRVVTPGPARPSKAVEDFDEVSDAEENEKKKSKPRRMKKAAVVEEAKEAPAEEAVEAPAEEAAAEAVEAPAEAPAEAEEAAAEAEEKAEE